MNEHAVASLYDALCTLESRWQKDAAYPVHKKLQFQDAATTDIYDWIMDQVDLPDHGSILDAGCGVGFGTIRLAQSCASRVTGISLSGKEIAIARRAAAAHDLADRVDFQRASFDSLPRATYDVIVAVESLKHSRDLRRTMQSLLRSLKPAGQLVIVEDIGTAEQHSEAASTISKDWELAKLYGEADYSATLSSVAYKAVDLTIGVRRSNRLNLAMRLALLELLLPCVRGRMEKALHAFRGGLYLQRLYADGSIAYKAIFCRLGNDTSL